MGTRSPSKRRRTKRGRVRTTLDDAALNVRTVRHLGRHLWRPVLRELRVRPRLRRR